LISELAMLQCASQRQHWILGLDHSSGGLRANCATIRAVMMWLCRGELVMLMASAQQRRAMHA
jgi:hypothetical protein